MTKIDWDIVFGLEWRPFEKKKLVLFQINYPKPVESDKFKEAFDDSGPWVADDFRVINEKFREFGKKSGHWYQIRGEYPGFQIFKMLPVS